MNSPSPARRTVRLISLGLLLGICVGCSDATKRKLIYRSPRDNYYNALEADNADVRRDAVARIAESRYVTDDNAFSVLDAVARTDPVDQIRCIAIRAFTRYQDRRPVPTLLAILEAGEGSDRALPLTEDIRWEAASALLVMEKRVLLTESEHDKTRRMYLGMIDEDNPKRIRVVAAEALGYFRQPDVLRPLIRAVGDEDFAIAWRAEYSLMRLTGQTHEYDADAWEEWLASTEDPFAKAGVMPEIEEPEKPSWWDRQKRAWRRGLRLNRED